MRTLLLAVALTMTSACSTIPTPKTVMAKTVVDEKALYAAEALYNIPATAYARLDQAGELPAGPKAAAKDKLIEMYGYLELLRHAYEVGSIDDFNAYKNTLQTLGGQVMAILPKHEH